MELCFYFDLNLKGVLKLNCGLCGREILPEHESKHHLNPVSQGGKNGITVIIHELCHRQIHALFTDFELSVFYNTLEKLKSATRIRRFLNWIEDKDVGLNVKIKESREKKYKRRQR